MVSLGKWVSPIEKRNFLKWFMEHHRLKRTEARKVLEYMINNSHIIENVYFVEKITLSRNTIVVSSVHSDEPGFIYYYNQRKTDDVSKALGDLMMNPTEKINLIIHFNGKMLNHRYLQLIGNPVLDNMKQYEQFQRYAKEVDVIIEKIMLEKEIEKLKQKIDLALDQKNEELFTKLAAKLKEYSEKKQAE